MNTHSQNREMQMPPALYEKYETIRAEVEKEVKQPVTRQQLSYVCWVYGNKLKAIRKS